MKWVDSFLDYLLYERNYSQRTVDEYQSDLKAFELFYKEFDEDLTWNTLNSDVVRLWVVAMMEKGNSAQSVKRRLSALRSFYRFLLLMGWVQQNPTTGVKGPKGEKRLPTFLRDSEMNALLDGDSFQKGWLGVRDRLVLLTFYVTGIRLSELTGLLCDDVDLSSCCIKVTGKRNKQRIIPLGDEWRDVYKSYLRERECVGISSRWVFLEADGSPIKNSTVEHLVKTALSRVTTQQKKSPHVLRHTFATSLLNHHADLETVKELLGHESLATTEVYTHVTFDELKRVYNEAHPRA